MALIMLLLVILVVFELLLSKISGDKLRKVSGNFLSGVLVVLSLRLLIIDFSVTAVIAALITLFRVINISRLIKGNKQREYLDNIYIRSALYLGLYVIILGLAYYILNTGFNFIGQIIVLLIAQFLGLLVLVLSLSRNYRKTSLKSGNFFIESLDLPSLTIAIPARNETNDLYECLDSLLLSDYPKLEILVLDDCSQTKHTPEIIRRYAQAGVRFIEGKVPPDSWSAKNFAYEQLSEQASSELILFCGVDVRFNQDTLRLMVEVLIAKKKKMISFMPVNTAANMNPIQKLAVQPWRYYWELALPRKFLHRPPVLSTCWIVYSEELRAMGGFKAVSRNILPERYFAKQIIIKGENYSFMRTNESQIKFTCQKDYLSQLATATRTYYPMLGSRLEGVLVVVLTKAAVLVLPFVTLVIGLISKNYGLAISSLALYLIGGISFSFVAKLTYSEGNFSAIIFMPFLALFDVYQSLRSMWLYEFKEVIWKDRNVCVPVMRLVKADEPNSDSGIRQ
jgi:chlorobactene glucosyltransferase